MNINYNIKDVKNIKNETDDFYKLLKSMQETEGGEECENSIINHDPNTDNVCLISGEPLKENSLTLKCNHTFNYKYLYNEVCNQKNRNNPTHHLESFKVRYNQIKCPYCREISNQLIEGIRKPKFPVMNLHETLLNMQIIEDWVNF